MAISVEHRSKAALHRQWWRLHMSEKFSSGTIISIQPTNIYQQCRLSSERVRTFLSLNCYENRPCESNPVSPKSRLLVSLLYQARYADLEYANCYLARRQIFFRCNVWVRQGENLSPFLFSIYIPDLEEFLLDNNVVGLQSITSTIENELLNIYFKLLVLFYADDTVIVAESADELQHALSEFQTYCSYWKLRVNVVQISE